MLPFTEDISVFYATLYGGIIIGFLFDIYIVLKSNFKFIKCFSAIFDVIFWIITTIITFITINAIESFDLRYYHFVALFLGFILYKATVSKIILKAANKFIQFIIRLCISLFKNCVSILNNLYYVIIYSIHLLFDIIFYIPTIINNRGKKVSTSKKKVLFKKMKKRV